MRSVAPEAVLRRLSADLLAYPRSRTLNGLAERDATGAVVGLSASSDVLDWAYIAGAPAALIVEAERLRRLTRHGRHQFDRLVRKVNRELAPYIDGYRVVGNVTRNTVTRKACAVETARVGEVAATAIAGRAVTADPACLIDPVSSPLTCNAPPLTRSGHPARDAA